MKAPSVFAVTTILGLIAVTPSFAQSGTPAANTVTSSLSGMRSSKLVGMVVYNGQGEKIGTVEDVLVKAGAEPTAVLSVGDYLGTGDKLVAVPLNHVQIDSSKVTMPTATKEHLASMPVFLFQPSFGGNG